MDYAAEFVDEGVTGFTFGMNDEEKFYGDVDALYQNRSLLMAMKRGAYEKSKPYSAENAWNVLCPFLADM